MAPIQRGTAALRRFADETGQSPLEYLQSSRVRRARHLLEATNRTVGSISAAVGYRDPSTFAALFDFGFTTFATPAVIRVLYVLGLVAIGLTYVVAVISGFIEGAGVGLLALVLGAVVALFYVILLRVGLEFSYAIVRMSEDIRTMRDRP